MARRRRRRQPPQRFVLREGRPVLEPDAVVWKQWLKASEKDRLVARSEFRDMQVITEFTGIDDIPRLVPGPPQLFKTTVIGGNGAGMFRAYVTAGEAKSGHKLMLKLLRKYFAKDDEPAE